MSQPDKVKTLFKRFGREVAILTTFSIFMWGLLYLPIGFMEGFNAHQWLVWFGITTWYDLPAEYVGAKMIIKFNALAKARLWY